MLPLTQVAEVKRIRRLPPGDQIREARRLKRWTQRDLAARLDVSVAYISKLENGKAPLPLERVSQVAQELKPYVKYRSFLKAVLTQRGLAEDEYAGLPGLLRGIAQRLKNLLF